MSLNSSHGKENQKIISLEDLEQDKFSIFPVQYKIWLTDQNCCRWSDDWLTIADQSINLLSTAHTPVRQLSATWRLFDKQSHRYAPKSFRNSKIANIVQAMTNRFTY